MEVKIGLISSWMGDRGCHFTFELQRGSDDTEN